MQELEDHGTAEEHATEIQAGAEEEEDKDKGQIPAQVMVEMD